IAAQDTFFAPSPLPDAGAMARDFRDSMAAVDGMTIDRELSETKIAGRVLHRVDFSGVGLHRAMFAAGIRCHVVSFHITIRDASLLEEIAASLNGLSAADGAAVPVCVKDYAVADNVLRRVEPVTSGASAAGVVPVRILIGVDGAVKHVHVIRASD